MPTYPPSMLQDPSAGGAIGAATVLLSRNPAGDNARPPTDIVDLILAVLNGVWCLVAIATGAYVTYWRHAYPPFRTKYVGLVNLMVLGAVLMSTGFVSYTGVFYRGEDESSFWVDCAFYDAFLPIMGVGCLTSVLATRVYRSYKVFVRKSADMYPPMMQALCNAAMFLVPTIGYYAFPHLTTWDPEMQLCVDYSPFVAYTVLGGSVNFALAGYFGSKLRNVRAQFNEYRPTVIMVIGGFAFAFSYPVINYFIFDSLPFVPGHVGLYNRSVGRKLLMLFSIGFGMIFIYGIIGHPLWMKLTNNQAYLEQFTYGFSNLPSPEEMQKSLHEQLTVKDLRENFKKFAGSRVAQENVDFYGACLDRFEIEDYFERLAKTMEIIDTYVRKGSPQEVNISEVTRNLILGEDNVDKWELFDRATSEVLTMMEFDLNPEYTQSELYKEKQKQLEEEAQELALLEKMGLKAKGVQQNPERSGMSQQKRSKSGSMSMDRGSRDRPQASRSTDEKPLPEAPKAEGPRSPVTRRRSGSSNAGRRGLLKKESSAGEMLPVAVPGVPVASTPSSDTPLTAQPETEADDDMV